MKNKKTYPPKKDKKSHKEKAKKSKNKNKNIHESDKDKSKNNDIKINISTDTNKEINNINENKLLTKNIKEDSLSSEEKNIIFDNILEEIESEKNYLKYDKTEEEIEHKLEDNKTHKLKKNTSIEVDENKKINEILEKKYEKDYLEVKGKKFDSPCEIEDKILYDGNIFYKDNHQTRSYPNIINYRCINYRKNERQRKSQFCKALLKRKTDKKIIYYILDKEHSKECIELNIKNIKIETNIIGSYNDYIKACFNYLDTTEDEKKNYSIELQNIYNQKEYDFLLKDNTIKNIIQRWKNTSLRFTKYNAIENKFNKRKELILWEYNNSALFTSNKKSPVSSEYFIWSCNQMIARARVSKHLYIDGTFHHPIGYSQLLIIIFKDIVTSDYLPCFYVLMSNKTEILYDIVFKSVKRILTQNNIFNLEIQTITTDTENALINAINNNFKNIQRLGCWFHLKQDLLREAKILGLLNPKNKKVDPELTLEVITQLSFLPVEYNGDIKYLENKINILAKQYNNYNNFINGYFMQTKLKYFKDGSFNYNKFPKDVRANSILERYNRTIKNELGAKRSCNWVVFLNFINKEIIRISDILSKNENINVLYESKNTKFGKEKFSRGKDNNIIIEINERRENNNLIENISNKWLIQKGNNCRYNSFITLLYFTITPFLYTLKDNNLVLLNKLNDLIINLSENVNDRNFCDIIIFLQKNKFDSNNAKIDEIINEKDEKKKEELIKKLKIDDTIDFSSSGYAAQLFSIFNNNEYFCIKENKVTECFICGRKTLEEIKEIQPFVFININNINNTSIFNLFLSKYKEIYSYACECRKNLPKNEDVLCLKIKYNILKYPEFLFLLFDFQYQDLVRYKDNIFNLLENRIVLNINAEYKLIGVISAPNRNHYNTVIFNPIGSTINSYFTANNIYYHDGMRNGGHIEAIKSGEDWKAIGIPYIALYKKLE